MGKKKKAATTTKTTKNKEGKSPIHTKEKSIPSSLVPKLEKASLKKKLQSQGAAPVLDALVSDAVFVSHDFFSELECKRWIEYAESANFEYVYHPASRIIAHRECSRIQVTDWEISKQIFQRMVQLNIISEIQKKANHIFSNNLHGGLSNYVPVTCNGNIRLYKYEKGMSFGKHIDGFQSVNHIQDGQTEMTVLIYLSSCTGGATTFYPAHSSSKRSRGVSFEPRTGSILFHIHGDKCLEHEADAVLSGVKYVLRTDLVYGTV